MCTLTARIAGTLQLFLQDLGAHWVWFCLEEALLHRPFPKLKSLKTAVGCRDKFTEVWTFPALEKSEWGFSCTPGWNSRAVCSISKGPFRAKTHCHQNLGTCCFRRNYTQTRPLVQCYNPKSVFASSLWARRVSLAYFCSSSIFFLRTRASSICRDENRVRSAQLRCWNLSCSAIPQHFPIHGILRNVLEILRWKGLQHLLLQLQSQVTEITNLGHFYWWPDVNCVLEASVHLCSWVLLCLTSCWVGTGTCAINFCWPSSHSLSLPPSSSD